MTCGHHLQRPLEPDERLAHLVQLTPPGGHVVVHLELGLGLGFGFGFGLGSDGCVRGGELGEGEDEGEG